MLATEIYEGSGLGNQLFFYVATRAIAMDRGLSFGTVTPEFFANNMHSDCGMYFMDIDPGTVVSGEGMPTYEEREVRYYTGNSNHDLTNGAYIAGPDPGLWDVQDGTLISGNLQDESYFIKHKEELKEWLKVKPEYDCMEYSDPDLCILHIRCSDYMNNPELYLRKKYWVKGMKRMKEHNPDMRFMIITNDVTAAGRLLPGIPAYNFDLAKDYSIIKNARNLLLSNSSFTLFPVFTSEFEQYIIAPKYWARHNVSNGYWASEQNIYSGFNYMDRKGRLFTAAECRTELAAFKTTKEYQKHLKPLRGIHLLTARLKVKRIRAVFWCERIVRSLRRRLHL